MRAFLALPIPDETVDALLRLQSAIPFGKPVPEENLHLTLAFLDDAPEDALEDLHDLLTGLRWPPVEIRFTGLDSFTEMERGLIFAAVDRSDALQGLHDRLASLCRSAGLDLPRRRFRPHVTLMRANRRPEGRTRDRLAAALGPVADLPGFTARAVTLYRSTLTPRGALHEALASYPLTG
ncbi:RNA 2',3'-cyclic phosphodiesterase [Roseicyclus persicicus]|uniref:RNA 2',3'-cyclic phosphodiesterase n=1 Tax=Roseicyclus persicicus TaxID=2650661 RepID=A0A7X6GVD7_9RHOB|nr:RNA 2',3'-cyclic phosphodiesterase [Roseibacterium persicicum]NKX42993.1 RNA 2',3'-cyclic phosphodiesterase [Roseibacterium persicicum]